MFDRDELDRYARREHAVLEAYRRAQGPQTDELVQPAQGRGGGGGAAFRRARIAGYTEDGKDFTGWLLDAAGEPEPELITIRAVGKRPIDDPLITCAPLIRPNQGWQSDVPVVQMDWSVGGAAATAEWVLLGHFIGMCNVALGVSAAPSLLDFGGVVVGQVGGPLDISVTNNSAAAVTVTATVQDPRSEPVFSIVSGASQQIDPGGSGTVSVEFEPDARGAMSAVCMLSVNSGVVEIPVAMSGQGLQGQLSVTPSPLDFGAIDNGEARELTWTVSNVGDAPLTVSAALLMGDPAIWQVTAGWGGTIQPGGALPLPVSCVAPLIGEGQISGVVRFTSELGGEDHGLIVIVGTTVLEIAPLTDVMRHCPYPWETAPMATYQVRNLGTAPVSVTVSVQPTGAGGYVASLDETDGNVQQLVLLVQPGESANVYVWWGRPGVPAGHWAALTSARVHFEWGDEQTNRFVYFGCAAPPEEAEAGFPPPDDSP